MKSFIFIVLFLLTVTLMAFWPCTHGSFLTSWDDSAHLTNNTTITKLSLNKINSIFHSSINKTFIPLTGLSFAIEHHFFGLNPFFYHLTNIALHGIVVALVLCLCLRLGLSLWSAGIATLFFALHPMHVESVAWITGRKDLLYSACFLSALLCYLRYVRDTKDWVFYSLSYFFGLLAIFAKPMALSLPLVLFLLDWFLKRPFSWNLILEKLPYLLLIEPVAWQTYALNQRVPEFHFPSSILIWIWSYTFYIQKFIAPLGLTNLYRLPEPVHLSNLVYSQSLLVFVLLWVFCYIGRRNRWLIFAVCFFTLNIFFLCRFDYYDLTIVADRYMYLSSVGICILIGKTIERRTILNVILLAIIFALMLMGTRYQSSVWKNDDTIWEKALEVDPKNYWAYRFRGFHYKYIGQDSLALNEYNQALALKPYYFLARVERGQIHTRLKHYPEALKDFYYALHTKLHTDETPVDVYINRAVLYTATKQYDKAIADYSHALQYTIENNADLFLTYNNRASLHYIVGDYKKALDDYDHALQVPIQSKSDISTALINRSRLLTEMSKKDNEN